MHIHGHDITNVERRKKREVVVMLAMNSLSNGEFDKFDKFFEDAKDQMYSFCKEIENTLWDISDLIEKNDSWVCRDPAIIFLGIAEDAMDKLWWEFDFVSLEKVVYVLKGLDTNDIQNVEIGFNDKSKKYYVKVQVASYDEADDLGYKLYHIAWIYVPECGYCHSNLSGEDWEIIIEFPD